MKKFWNIVFGLVIIVGIGVMLYPAISDIITQYQQNQVVNEYNNCVSDMDEESYELELADAYAYNAQIALYPTVSKAFHAQGNFTGRKYNELLDVGGIGVMGVLEIPVVDVELPIYHGTSVDTLMVGVGHYEGSSLPVGGESTHCVLTGHRGLPSSRLLTDIDQLEVGDIFYIHVLNQHLAYEVDQIKTVLPEELNDINVISGEDYCTLVTCTPYGVNSHRLLVRGKRIIYADLSEELQNEVYRFPLILALSVALLVYALVVLVRRRMKMKKK